MIKLSSSETQNEGSGKNDNDFRKITKNSFKNRQIKPLFIELAKLLEKSKMSQSCYFLPTVMSSAKMRWRFIAYYVYRNGTGEKKGRNVFMTREDTTKVLLLMWFFLVSFVRMFCGWHYYTSTHTGEMVAIIRKRQKEGEGWHKLRYYCTEETIAS